MRRLLVTGGAGFIGSNFVRHWLQNNPGDRVLVLDALTYAGNRANLAAFAAQASFRFVHGNICDQSLVTRLLREESLDTIVHFAAESHVDRSINAPAAFIETNINGTHSLLESARTVWLTEQPGCPHRFHHVSTDEVFGSLSPEDPPVAEQSQYAPNSPYSASKAAADHLVRAYQHTYGLQVTISHCTNNYGPYHYPEKLIPLMITNILRGKPLPVYGDGRNIRDWLHVSDHCRALELILKRGQPAESYNIGGRSEAENLQLVRVLCEIAEQLLTVRPQIKEQYPNCQVQRLATLVRMVADRPGHDRRYATDCGKIQRELGFKPVVELRKGLADTFTWFVENPTWWGYGLPYA